jgi:hypothetical protein
MPNWCDNELRIEGKKEDVDAFLAFVKGEEDGEEVVFDFNKLIPMPAELNVDYTSQSKVAYAAKYGSDEDVAGVLEWTWVKEKSVSTRDELLAMLERDEPQSLSLADRQKQNVERHGHGDWHHWRVENWGTKWNASDSVIDDESEYQGDKEVMIRFDTAWSPPIPVIKIAAERFPTLRFTLTYFECGCAFHGRFVCDGGEVEDDLVAEYYGSRGG